MTSAHQCNGSMQSISSCLSGSLPLEYHYSQPHCLLRGPILGRWQEEEGGKFALGSAVLLTLQRILLCRSDMYLNGHHFLYERLHQLRSSQQFGLALPSIWMILMSSLSMVPTFQKRLFMGSVCTTPSTLAFCGKMHDSLISEDIW